MSASVQERGTIGSPLVDSAGSGVLSVALQPNVGGTVYSEP